LRNPQSRKLLAETLCVVGLVFALFGAFVLWEGEPFMPGGRSIDQLLLAFFDPMTAMLVFGWSSTAFGIALVALGIYTLLQRVP
jgi:hypothetical protein